MLTKIWERYLLRQMATSCFFVLFCFYGLYVLIDYATHSHSFSHYHFSAIDIAKFYGGEFVLRLEILLPFSTLIACIHTLCRLNKQNELMALMVAGIPLKRLLWPLVLLGLLFTLLLYASNEWLQPRSLRYHQKLANVRAKAKRQKYSAANIQQITLTDGSFLIFQSYLPETSTFEDLFWVRSLDEIYRMRTLQAREGQAPIGYDGQKLERIKIESRQENEIEESVLYPSLFFKEHVFDDLAIDDDKLKESIISPENQAISELYRKLPKRGLAQNAKEARLETAFHHKMALPLLCLLAIIAPAPFCTRFSRTQPQLVIYALSLFGLIACYLVINASVILGERQVLPAFMAIWLPFSAFFLFFGWRFLRKCS